MLWKGPSVNVKRLLYTPVGRIIVSVVFGLGIAALFYKACDDKSCIVFRGPNINVLDGRIFQHGDSCYTNQVVSTQCSSSRKTIEISGAFDPVTAAAMGGMATPTPTTASSSSSSSPIPGVDSMVDSISSSWKSFWTPKDIPMETKENPNK